MEQLDRQTVKFQIPARRGAIHGIGEFLVRRSPGGFLAIDILFDTLVATETWEQCRVHVPQTGVDCIEVHPDQSVAHFRLFAD